ncbi:hypothetical protein AUK40_02205 [Candidatus Wirthbacteria bacterium CG2_30_54_11]|uniref:GTP-binding protein n=1 Tax=Candidatus Wirthbacteria bacterium CG2_30_54_11 TaxID=1817892 RepID=A0A1J5IU78_9BACT|nr:MAG: hypothetical protein AUK40_02205 [Candidatus Wirthbacteria bacterium CG2_30_54_11]
MGSIHDPKPVKLFIGILLKDTTLRDELTCLLENSFGAIDIRSELIPFTFTDYYRSEMGEGLTRIFCSFLTLIDPAELARIKLATNALEKKFADQYASQQVARPCNLDPGYLEVSKIILASTKNFSHRIYLSRGIYAEITLQYQNKHFTDLPWTYPDFKTEPYQYFLEQVRTAYLSQIKNN